MVVAGSCFPRISRKGSPGAASPWSTHSRRSLTRCSPRSSHILEPGTPNPEPGLLEAQWVEGEAPHPRKYYRLTRLGAKRLADMKGEWRAFAEKIDRLMKASERTAREAH